MRIPSTSTAGAGMKICFKVRESGKPLKGYILAGNRKIEVDGCVDVDTNLLSRGFIFQGKYMEKEFEYRFEEPFSEVLLSERELLYDARSLDLRMVEMLVFSRINSFRSQNGLESLSWSEKLAKAARFKSRVISKDFKHDAMGMNSFRLLRERGIYFISVGENIYRITGLKSTITEEKIAERCVKGWKTSKGHRKVMLSDFTHCGIGVYAENKSVFITLIATLNRFVIESEFTKNQTLLLQPVDDEFNGSVKISIKTYPNGCFSLSYPENAGKDDFIEVKVLSSCQGRIVVEYESV